MNVLQFLEKNNVSYNDEIRGIFYKKYIKSVEEAPNSEGKRRIILTNVSNSYNSTCPMEAECNGLILEHNTHTNKYTVLNMPSYKSIVCKNYKQFTNSYDNYDVYKVYDGTIMNLYYYNNKWCFSTFRGYEVNNKLFYKKSYKEIFDLITSQYYPQFSYDKLNKNKCYTFCVKYNEYHLFSSPIISDNYIYLIQSVDVNKLNNERVLDINYYEDVGVNIQEAIDKSEFSLSNLLELAHSSYNRYKNSILNKNPFKKIEEPCFGFILKTKDINITTGTSCIFIESYLYTCIKDILYKNIFDDSTMHDINKQDIMLYNIINVFLQYKDKKKITILFPRYKNVYYLMNKLTYQSVPKFIMNNISLLNNSGNLNDMINNQKKIKYNFRGFENYEMTNSEKIKELSIKLYCFIINSNIAINHTELSEKTIIDFIHDKRFTEYFYEYFINH